MKSKIIKLAVIPAIIIGIAAQLFFSSTTATVPVITAKIPISAGMVIKEDMLNTIQVPKTVLPSGAVQDAKDIIGKKIMVSRLPGDIMLTDAFREEQQILSQNEVLMSVQIHDSITGFIKEGSKITIIGLPVNGMPLKMFEKVPVHSVIKINEPGGAKTYAVIKLQNTQAQELAPYIPQNAVQITVAE